MLLGRYEHTVDTKGRVSVPARFREDLGERFVITRGLDSCLALYSLNEWAVLAEKVKQLPMAQARTIQRYLFTGAYETDIDAQGRMVIPQNLRAFAGITKDVVIAGLSNRAEVWDKETFDKAESDVSADDVVELMSQLGF